MFFNITIIMFNKNKFASEMLDFIKKSPSCFHVIKNISETLISRGFQKLDEKEKWILQEGGKYFVTRNNSSIISFSVPKKDFKGFMMSASHSDSPSFKIKENPEMKSCGYVKLNVEKYGGMLMHPWFDRPLSIAGRIIKEEKTEGNRISLKEELINFDRDLVMIPNLAIHMNRDANEGKKINVQNELMPVFSSDENATLKSLISKECGIEEKDIISYDLFLYNRTEPTFWGEKNQFISSAKLDDLECAWTTFQGFLKASEAKTDSCLVHCIFDNEEVGSESRQGAASTFLSDTLMRINENLGRTSEDYKTALANSFMVSADNAHGIHPNYPETADPNNRPKLNGGIVIKFNAAQKYTSDAISSGFFRQVCRKAKVPFQIFTNNSNIAGGSTLGNISTSQVSVSSVDIGLAQWAMHSPYESAGAEDPEMMAKAIEEFYKSTFELI